MVNYSIVLPTFLATHSYNLVMLATELSTSYNMHTY